MRFGIPRYIQLYPTTRCNQNCIFCFNVNNKKIRDLTFGDSLKLLDILSDLDIREIDIMGGEPLLLSWMPDFVRNAIRKNIAINISTNGSNTDILKRFPGANPGMLNIGVSLEGSTAAKHDTITNSKHFKSSFNSIQALIDLELNPVVKTVITKSSLGDIRNIINILRDAGVRRYCILHMDLFSLNASLKNDCLSYTAFSEFYNEIRLENHDISIDKVHASCFDKNNLPSGTRCAGGVNKLSVLPDGSVFPCNLFHAIGRFNLGNIFKDDFSEIWMNPKLDIFREFRTNRCGVEGCDNRQSCTGGCPAHGLYHYGDPDRADIRCLL
ncbi:MAG: radical SAM protein [Nitrospirota bacterium]